MTTKLKIIISTSIMVISLLSITVLLFTNNHSKPPLIHGIIVPDSTIIKSFSILDQHNNIFNNDNLKGHWSLLSYGYTHCPDICPTTLNVLNKFFTSVEKNQRFSDLQILFYSIDYKRDTVERLTEYMPFFNANFIGLTHLDNKESRQSAESLEKSLGLIAQLTTINNNNSENKNKPLDPIQNPYTVGHGVMLYLINPEGNLQAVFKPFVGRGQIQYFTQKQISEDYIKVREYFNSSS